MKIKLIAVIMALVMGLQSMAHAGNSQPVQPEKPKTQFFVAALVVIAVAIIATIFYQLYKLCKKCIPNSPAPPPDHKSNNVIIKNSGATQFYEDNPQIKIRFTPTLDYFGCITNKTPDFQTPSGTYYDGIFTANVFTKTSNTFCEPCGTITAWISEDFLKIEEKDKNGVSLWVKTTTDWQNAGMINLLSSQFPPSDDRYFQLIPNP